MTELPAAIRGLQLEVDRYTIMLEVHVFVHTRVTQLELRLPDRDARTTQVAFQREHDRQSSANGDQR
jgi:hypothetical protein